MTRENPVTFRPFSRWKGWKQGRELSADVRQSRTQVSEKHVTKRKAKIMNATKPKDLRAVAIGAITGHLKRLSWLFITGLAVCALWQVTTAAGTKKQVTKPFAERAHQVVVADMASLGYDFPFIHWTIREEVGEATHWGRFVSEGEGRFNVLTGENTGTGEVITASKDILEWSLAYNPDGTATVDWIGISGRFTGATASAVLRITVEGVTSEGDGRYAVYTQTFEGKGTITY